MPIGNSPELTSERRLSKAVAEPTSVSTVVEGPCSNQGTVAGLRLGQLQRFATLRFCLPVLIALTAFSSFCQAQRAPVSNRNPISNDSSISTEQTILIGVEQILKLQSEEGAWPYEGVYRVNRKIPVGYRIGGTALCCEALFYATSNDDENANRAIERGIRLILSELDDPLMKPSQVDRYDVRVWGHIYALDLFCRLKGSNRFPQLEQKIRHWRTKLTDALLFEELKSGGWNYANRRAHAGFVTATAVQALLWARQSGEDVSDDVFQRASDAILRSRNETGAFSYSGNDRNGRPAKLPGSIARSANCELTLSLLGHTRQAEIKHAIDAFHEHWNELEKRRKKTGTHKPPFGVAPYYFYYGHRYAAQAIQALPNETQQVEFEKLNKVLMKTRDADGTWNDRVFDRSKAYGTAMAVLSLLESKVGLPNRIELASDFKGNSMTVEANDGLSFIYLVRHAEKLTGKDPLLTEHGTRRAKNYADTFAQSQIQHVYSTDFHRTRLTAGPLAEQLDLEIQIYDPGDLARIAGQLLRLKHNAIVVGHSNTTPELVTQLGGEAGVEIDEGSEFGRVYQLIIKDGKVIHTNRFTSSNR